KWEGDKYIGEYKNGKKDGQGTYTFSDGRKYEGEFREGTFWNITEYDKNGNIIGNYVNGVKQ
ncbi:MAG: MORN motif-containing protein, partial [SAR324 cluster bacterium]|nr:MORN motif-containing protein [SAR324 cluster bacterium]